MTESEDKLLFTYENNEFHLEIKTYGNGYVAYLTRDYRVRTPFVEMPIFNKLTKLLNSYDFQQSGTVGFHMVPPETYIFLRHEIPKDLPKLKKEFVLEDFKNEFIKLIQNVHH